MPIGGGFSKSDGSSSSWFNQNVMNQQIPALQNLWGSAGDLYGSQDNTQFNQMASQLTPWMFSQAQVANPAYQQQLQGGIQDPAMTRNLNEFLQSPSNAQSIYQSVLGGAGQSFADPLVQQLQRDMQVNMNRGEMRDLNTGYNSLGRPGSDRNVLQRALTDAENNRNFGLLSAGIRQGAQADDLAMQMKIAEQADANKLAGLQLGFNNLNQQNANQQGAFGLGQNLQNLGMGTYAPWMTTQQQPWNMMGNYSGVIGDPTVLSSGGSKGKTNSMGFNASVGGMG